MYEVQRQFPTDRFTVLRGLAACSFEGDDDIPKVTNARGVHISKGEGEHVGRAILSEPLPFERPDVLVLNEAQRKLYFPFDETREHAPSEVRKGATVGESSPACALCIQDDRRKELHGALLRGTTIALATVQRTEDGHRLHAADCCRRVHRAVVVDARQRVDEGVADEV